MEIYQTARAKALHDKRFLVIELGAEWCTWCVALHKMMNKETFWKELKEKYIFINIALFNGKKKIPEEFNVFKDLDKNIVSKFKGMKGYPHLAILNPQNKKTFHINTEALENNVNGKHEHHEYKVINILKKGTDKIR